MQRAIITTIDSITHLLHDFLDLPPDGRPVRLLRDPTSRLLAIDVVAPTPIYPAPELRARFQLRRIFGGRQ